MKNIAIKSILLSAFFSPWVSADGCNASDGLDGWAVWCGVDTYLAQQEPTAAGFVGGEGLEIAFLDVRTAAFGGALTTPETPSTPSTPSTLTPLNRMADFALQNRIATYSGSGDYGSLGRVDNTIEVNFGNASWVGNWGGAVGVGALGSISGNQFSSNSIVASVAPGSPPRGTPPPAIVPTSGLIQGSFNGNNAGSLTGTLDIVKGGSAINGTFENIIP